MRLIVYNRIALLVNLTNQALYYEGLVFNIYIA